MEIAPIWLPHNLERMINPSQDANDEAQQKYERQKKLKENCFKPQVSSFVLATNGFGDFSKCTIISQPLTNDDLEKDIAPNTGRLWREFMHQPQTGRCLVFFQMLETVTKKMTKQYKEALVRLESVLDLDVCPGGLAYNFY
jgi:hypothetical protein